MFLGVSFFASDALFRTAPFAAAFSVFYLAAFTLTSSPLAGCLTSPFPAGRSGISACRIVGLSGILKGAFFVFEHVPNQLRPVYLWLFVYSPKSFWPV